MSFRYDHQALIASCESRGLVRDTKAAEVADKVAAASHLTQDQFESAVQMHIDRVADMWARGRYPWKVRLAIAAYWLGLTRREIK